MEQTRSVNSIEDVIPVFILPLERFTTGVGIPL